MLSFASTLDTMQLVLMLATSWDAAFFNGSIVVITAAADGKVLSLFVNAKPCSFPMRLVRTFTRVSLAREPRNITCGGRTACCRVDLFIHYGIVLLKRPAFEHHAHCFLFRDTGASSILKNL